MTTLKKIAVTVCVTDMECHISEMFDGNEAYSINKCS